MLRFSYSACISHRHLAALRRGVGVDRLKRVRNVLHAKLILLVVDPIELARLVRRRGDHHAVVQVENEIGLVAGERQRAVVGENRSAARGVVDVVDRDVAHLAGLVAVDVAGAQIELAFLDRIDHLLLEGEARLRPQDRELEGRQLVVRARAPGR
jgi:hypothetical protein